MELVIKISEEDFTKVKDGRAGVKMMRDAIRNGIPLSKGHGTLKDSDEIFTKLQNYHDDCAVTSKYTRSGFETAMEVIKDAQPIIEADKSKSEE